MSSLYPVSTFSMIKSTPHLDNSLFPCPQFEEGISVGTDEYQPDVFEDETDVGVYESRCVEFG